MEFRKHFQQQVRWVGRGGVEDGGYRGSYMDGKGDGKREEGKSERKNPHGNTWTIGERLKFSNIEHVK